MRNPRLTISAVDQIGPNKWIYIEHIPWDENPLVVLELKKLASSRKINCRPLKCEWRYKGKIYHRDVFNNVWQKVEGKMKWIGSYNPATDTFDYTALEPKY